MNCLLQMAETDCLAQGKHREDMTDANYSSFYLFYDLLITVHIVLCCQILLSVQLLSSVFNI